MEIEKSLTMIQEINIKFQWDTEAIWLFGAHYAHSGVWPNQLKEAKRKVIHCLFITIELVYVK
jgi:hypothetical protein